MKPSQDTYPIFEANQVLSYLHLNESFSYLDEQERLTRANLIGIGIVCGLDIRVDEGTGTISLSRGCGVTSEGYLIIEPEDVVLAGYKPYILPTEPKYAPFLKNDIQYDLWELFPANEPDTTLLTSPQDFMHGKAVLLFLELKKEGLRNCSLNNCDDRGSQITITLRRLLINRTDLDSIIAAANQLPDVGSSDLEAALLDRLNLPDLRLPRFNVPNTGPATSQDVLAAFEAVFTSEKLAKNLGDALTAAYNGFLPLLQEKYPSNPFAGFFARFGFLDTAPATTAQVRFLQYYYDFFDDLLGAYNEFRWKGFALLCVCCPPDGWFPRHLMLGLLFPNEVNNPGIYRHHFLPSPAAGCCEGRSRELGQFFDRLVEMIASFTENPPLAQPPDSARAAVPVRITPSKLGCAPLSGKAIPYYYLENGTPPLYQLWSPEKTRLNRANQNLSYRSDEYQPAAPPFITNPLRYDLEPYNFLRVEGHLGQNYLPVLSTLLSLKSRFRLPIDIVALRTGAFDGKVPVDLSKESCHFQDLEALYDTLKAELICFLCKEVQYFYSIPFEMRSIPPAKPLLPLLVQCAPDFMVQPQTLGSLFEDWLGKQTTIPDIDPNIIINFLNSQNVGQNNIIIFYIIIYVEKLYEQITADLQQFDIAKFEKRYSDLVLVTEAIEREREDAAGTIDGNVALLKWEELDDRLEAIIYHCRLEAFKALVEEYLRRITEVKQKEFLSFFLRDHPGIQHKAGVPLGGTFVLVYHAAPPPPDFTFENPVFTGVGGRKAFAAATEFDRSCIAKFDNPAMREALTRISANPNLAIDPDIRLVLGGLVGRVPDFHHFPPITAAGDIIDQAVKELADGTVIADFYLPYLCCSDCAPIQFVLPKEPPTFTVQIACTNANNEAEVTVTAEGGLAPYSVKVDDKDYQPLEGALVLAAGSHLLVLRDAEGTETPPRTIVVQPRLAAGDPAFDCIGDGEYVATFQISGGTPPYSANRGTVDGNTYSSDALPADADTDIVITDKAGCTATTKLRHSCPALSFTIEVGCTQQNVAPVKVTPAGGTPPYQVQIDNNPPVPGADPLPLGAGSHVISVRDAAGHVAPSQTVVIPPELRVSETGFSCEGTTSYRSTLAILGGTPPYSVNGNPIPGNAFTTDPIPNNTSVPITVTDKNQCTAATEVQHSCEPACTLPCGGISRRCAYRLWLQPPEGAPYEIQQQNSAVTLIFNDRDIPLPDTSALLQFAAGDLNNAFDNTVNAGIKKLNEIINDALVAALGDAGKNRLVISVADPAEPHPFATLWIEHFVCDKFDLAFSYTYAKPNPAYALTVHYTNSSTFNGMVTVNRRLNNKETRVPAFDCAQRNQCTNSAFEIVCRGALPKPLFESQSTDGHTSVFKGQVENPAEVTVVAWVWDILLAQPAEPFYEGQEVTAVLQQIRGPVRLTAITNDGCFGINERSIDIIL